MVEFEKDESSVIITLGIGHDVKAEVAIKEKLPEGSKFYGADPMQETNEKLYTEIGGVYFPFAVGAGSGMHTASVLKNGSMTEYYNKNVVHIDLVYFLKSIIREKFIDDLWIDAEGAEYDLMPYFYSGGQFDQAGITICQFNMEVHKADSTMKATFHKFIIRILEDGRYAFFRPVKGAHYRLYFLNFAHPKRHGNFTNNSNELHSTKNGKRDEIPNYSDNRNPYLPIHILPFYNKWKDCVNQVLERVSKDPAKFWSTWFKHANKCEEVWSKQLEVRGFRNLDETKYHVLPLNNEPSVIVTIGIGHDTTAEEKLRLLIDDLWIDAEGAEYSMLHHFYRNGPLDQHNITICQFNIEIHQPNDDRKRQFHKFFQQMMGEERYVFFK
ncbi:hypothetical protein WR25_09016 [Diploscapter pachys]|uniref:Methyltransferase FkbM domain-containing protein n=1 Tax=Diploscapter pachys TaxID=2018661 RepID=A0A2A2M1B7_9BILA|nr:hypothetical protein WR25_09016 [Diploscapter pachys]